MSLFKLTLISSLLAGEGAMDGLDNERNSIEGEQVLKMI